MSKLTTLVTGASSGIGAAVCRRIATPGHQLLIHARGGSDGSDRAPLQQVADELRDCGAIVETVYADLAESGAGKSLVDAALDRFGGLDQIVSNAGFADRRHLGEVDRETLDRSLTTMTGAFFDMTTAAMESLRSSSCGRVVAISSFVAHHYTSDTLFPVTAAAKSAVEALAKSLAVQLGPHQVTVNCVVPGYTQKDEGTHRAISPEALQEAANRSLTKRISQPDDIAAAVQFLLSEDARQITGQTIHVDGGLGVT
jgi:3-oxoacyl-[acyl-carrier protein] reductase